MGQDFTDSGVSDAERGIGLSRARVEPLTSDAAQASPQTFEVNFDSDFGEVFEEYRAIAIKELEVNAHLATIASQIAHIRRLDAKSLLAESIDEADEILRKVIPRIRALSSNPDSSTCESIVFNDLFRTESTEQFILTRDSVASALEKVRAGDVGIRSSQVTYYDGGIMCFDFIGGYTPKLSSTSCHICYFCWTDLFESVQPNGTYNLGALSQTVIHEAVHRLGGFTYRDISYDGLESLSLSDALANAHSYAVCATRMATCP